MLKITILKVLDNLLTFKTSSKLLTFKTSTGSNKS